MKIKLLFPILLLFTSTISWGRAKSVEPGSETNLLNTPLIERLSGTKGTLIEKEGVFKLTSPRTDLNVTMKNVKITPPMGLAAWIAFKPMEDRFMIMGDLVLLEEQVNPMISLVLENNLEITAIHNHFAMENPKILFMHVSGMGTQETLAKAAGNIFAKLKEIPSENRAPQTLLDPKNTKFNVKKIENILGHKGELNGGVYKVTIGRTARMGETEIGNAMGVNTWAAFIGSDTDAFVDGDFVMLESEVQDVLKALRHANINIVALHNHMFGESPRQAFLHYWARGNLEDLAKGLRAALDTQKE